MHPNVGKKDPAVRSPSKDILEHRWHRRASRPWWFFLRLTGIACGTECTENYTSRTSVTLTAAPATGATFLGWSGGPAVGRDVCTVTLDQSRTGPGCMPQGRDRTPRQPVDAVNLASLIASQVPLVLA